MADETAGRGPEGGTPAAGRAKFVLEVVLVRIRFLMLFVVVGVVAGQWERITAYWERWTRPAPEAGPAASAVEYFCPMHPQIVRDAFGPCPICGMPLSRRAKGAKETLPEGVLARVQLSPYRIAQAGIRTAEVAPRPLVREVRAVGFVEVDERRLGRIAARVPGRVDELFVDFTGRTVKEGDPLLSLYSPELVAAEEALQSSARALEEARRAGTGEDAVARAQRVLDSARERLRLWGLAPEQVDAVLAGGKPETHVTVRAPLAGTVLRRAVSRGQYVMEGDPLYEIADLGRVWVRVRMFSGDLAVAREGTEVAATTDAWPGEEFRGKVAFVDPVLDPASRTFGVRVDMENPAGRLLPGMYAMATIRTPVAELEPFRSAAAPVPKPAGAPAGEAWTCSMYASVVATGPGKCPECGMDLEKRALRPGEKVEWWCPMHPGVTADHAGEACAKCDGMKLVARIAAEAVAGSVLAVPEAAVVDTGTRKVVYRESSPGVFDAVEVVLGPRAGGWYAVISGLANGDRVAAAGAFLIDAETRLNPSAAAAYFGATGAPSGGGKGGHEGHGGR